MRFCNRSRRHRQFIIIMVFLFSVLCLPFLSSADQKLPSAGIRNQTIRVLLSRMNLSDRLHVKLTSPYLLQNDDGMQMLLREETEAAFLLRGDKIYLHVDGITLEAGRTIEMVRAGNNEVGESGFYRVHFPELYLGDLRLDIKEGQLRPVLSIHVEDYLFGVVPYEMSESFPLEALKAQAVAARTYALRKQNENRDYDVVDTTNDQVFKGYLSGNPTAERAVRETSGVCGFYKGKLAQCYYSASNGGQMELVESVWETDADYGYYTFGADPYDVENPESVVRSFEIQKENADHPALKEVVAEALREELEQRGYVAEKENIRIDQMMNVSLGRPDNAESLLMTQLQLTMKISAQRKIQVVDNDTEEVSLFLSEQPQVTAASTIQPTFFPETRYTDFQTIAAPFEILIPIFPNAEKTFGMDISSNFENEIWSVKETEDHFILEARRYGHGVGMSQRGAQWMASQYHKTYEEILGFYYPGMKLMQFDEMAVDFAHVSEALQEEAGAAPSPTPRPTVMPLTLSVGKGQWIAKVTEISQDSSLNLRSEPNLSSEIKMRLYYGQQLLVVEECEEDGWLKVQTDVAEGYVMAQYLTHK